MQNYEELETQNKYYKGIMHDIRFHLNLIKAEGKFNPEYYQEVIEVINKKESIVKCSDPILNVIINDRIMYCKNSGIKIEVEIEDVDLSFMRKMDITTIFFNLINNAIEACKEVNDDDNRYIELKIKKVQSYIVVSIKNSCNGCPLKNYQEGKSYKSGHMGMGIYNVKRALKQYDSTLDLQEGEGYFEAKFAIEEL